MDMYDVPFSVHSALFRAVNKSMFINDKLSNQIVWLKGDKNDLLDIHNEKRLKSILFKEIKTYYNDRINSHNLNLIRLGDNNINNFYIKRFCLIDEKDKGNSTSGL